MRDGPLPVLASGIIPTILFGSYGLIEKRGAGKFYRCFAEEGFACFGVELVGDGHDGCWEGGDMLGSYFLGGWDE